MDKNIQAMPLGRGNATSPYTVQEEDSVIEFAEDGDVVTADLAGTTKTTTVLGGSRYAIGNGTATITFAGAFNVG